MKLKKALYILLCIVLLSFTLIGCQEATLPADKPEDPPVPPPPPPVLVEYTGVVEHIFIHPLIAYPEVAFGGYQRDGFDDWFITVPEFERLLVSLHERDFILVDINDIYEEYEAANGRTLMRRAELLLPEGKKPIILSIDDANYYDYMIKNGIIHKLVLDENGEIATYSIDPKTKEEVVSRDNEFVPILDDFVKQHPDFSHNGAKGTIALTGYEGILGYRTQYNNSNRAAEIEAVKPIIERLKETGWNFASHSFGHPHLPNMAYDRFVRDTLRWNTDVRELVGPTQVYIYPFGARVTYGSDKMKFLQQHGFRIFCAVGPTSHERISTTSPAVMTDRRAIHGFGFRNQRHLFNDLYDTDEVMDVEARPRR